MKLSLIEKRFWVEAIQKNVLSYEEKQQIFPLYFFGIWRQQPIRMFELVVNFWLLRRIFVSRSRATFGWGTIRNSEWERFFGKFPGKTQILKFSRCSAKFSLTLHSHEAPYSFFLLSVCPSFSHFLPYYVFFSLSLYLSLRLILLIHLFSSFSVSFFLSLFPYNFPHPLSSYITLSLLPTLLYNNL